MTGRRPTTRARWLAAHFVVGSIVLGGFFAAFMFVTGLAFRGESLTAMLWGTPFWFLFGPAMVAITRYQVRRFDSHNAVSAR